MQRVFKYILYIVIIIAIILLVAWVRSRKAAQQSGTNPLSFRQFLGLGSSTPAPATETPDTGLTPDFTTPDETTPDQPSGGTVTSSNFTTGPMSPAQGGSTSGSSNNSSGGSLVGGNTTGTTTPSVIPAPATTGAPVTNPLAQCSDEDITIEFTAAEISRLNDLQNRFYAISGILHTDGDVQNEITNYDEFKGKVNQINELYNYCVAKAPAITAPLYSNRTFTPFWREAGKDGVGYISGKYNGWEWVKLDSQEWNPREAEARPVIEQIFKLNLW